MNLDNVKNEGGIYIRENFFSEEQLSKIKNDFKSKTFYSHHQPEKYECGNRFQAYPCYQNEEDTSDVCYTIGNYFKTAFDDNFRVEAIYRKVYSEELLKSKCNTRYGFIHKDGGMRETCIYAGVVYMDFTVTGGTAFFNSPADKFPDIEIGAVPNRLILYDNLRYHAPSHDFTYEVRENICFFIYDK
tara:strand:+ start:1226 stop:1786 length:561 start_codon:yes stop_codon:yes gene_type:complete